MDYQMFKNEANNNKQNKKTALIILLMACIIAVNCVVISVLWIANRQYKAMYDEALSSRLLMQQEINSLRGNQEETAVEQDSGYESEETAVEDSGGYEVDG